MKSDIDAELDTPYVVTTEQVQRLNDDGYVKIRQVFTRATIAGLRSQVEQALLRHSQESRSLNERDTYGQAFLQVGNLWKHDAAVRALTGSRRLASLLAGLLAVPALRLYHDQGLCKEAGGGRTPMHTDIGYIPLATDRVCAAWIPLHDVPVEQGALGFVPGSHRLDELHDLAVEEASEARMQEVMAAQRLNLITEAFAAGDISVHLARTAHAAGANSTPHPRTALNVFAFADGARHLNEPRSAFQRRYWPGPNLPGARPGAVIDAPANPLLWPRAAGLLPLPDDV